MLQQPAELLDDILYAIHALPNTVYKGTYSQTYASNFVSKENILEFFVRDWDSEFKQAFSKKYINCIIDDYKELHRDGNFVEIEIHYITSVTLKGLWLKVLNSEWKSPRLRF